LNGWRRCWQRRLAEASSRKQNDDLQATSFQRRTSTKSFQIVIFCGHPLNVCHRLFNYFYSELYFLIFFWFTRVKIEIKMKTSFYLFLGECCRKVLSHHKSEKRAWPGQLSRKVGLIHFQKLNKNFSAQLARIS
jgi:hypothetical protein